MNVVVEGGGSQMLTPEAGGYFGGAFKAPAGTRYKFQLDGGELYPDPVSRFQPDGPFGWSEVVDPTFAWTDGKWRGAQLKGQVIYEMHVGTFTPEGTWAAATHQLPELARVGISVIELMPVADFPGKFGWGYDGVNLFAPTRLYGSPHDMRRFVDEAHRNGIAVILDVVYNHLGPSGNFLKTFSEDYFSSTKNTDWGPAINYDGPTAKPVREFVCANASYWIEEFHLDGLRLDATQDIHDESGRHIIEEVGARVRKAAGGRDTILIAENEPQHCRLARPVSKGGFGLDGLWNDDFHHTAMVTLTGKREAYYTDYTGSAHELMAASRHGYLYQGQRYSWQKQNRGTSSRGLPPEAFISYVQNHDQVANSIRGTRGHALTSPGRWRAMTMLMLLGPGTPMLFQGQEFSSSARFLYFADHEPSLASAILKGRAEFLAQFPSIVTEEATASLDDPADPASFSCCKLDFTERETHRESYDLHRELLQIRKSAPVFYSVPDGAVLNDRAFFLRYFSEDEADLLLVVNFGEDYLPASIAQPLLAPPDGRSWRMRVSTEEVRYGGGGAYSPCDNGNWRIPGEAAVLLEATAE